MASHRRPHPYAAWPQHSPRPWEDAAPETGPCKGASIQIRSDPSMLPFGAREKRVELPHEPSRVCDAGVMLGSMETAAGTTKKKRDALKKKITWGEKVLKELEAFLPKIKPLRELYSGQKFVTIQLKGEQCFCAGILPTNSALFSTAVNFAAGYMLRSLVSVLPGLSAHSGEARDPFNYGPVQGPIASVVLFFWGVLACIFVRNRFGASRLFHGALFVVSLFLSVVSEPGMQSSALPWLLGQCLGSYIALSLGEKAVPAPPPKALVQGEQPQAWESERWLAAIWSAQLDDGWVRMPPLAEDKLEAAHMNHAAQVTLEAGEFGEHQYVVDLLNGVAKCTAKPFNQRLVRRMPVKH